MADSPWANQTLICENVGLWVKRMWLVSSSLFDKSYFYSLETFSTATVILALFILHGCTVTHQGANYDQMCFFPHRYVPLLPNWLQINRHMVFTVYQRQKFEQILSAPVTWKMAWACKRLLCTSEEPIPDIKLSVNLKPHVSVEAEVYCILIWRQEPLQWYFSVGMQERSRKQQSR